MPSLRTLPDRLRGPLLGLVLGLLPAGLSAAPIEPNEDKAFHAGNIGRELRYEPQGRDFVAVKGDGWFNRSLYGGSSKFRADAGDVPEFSLYLPGRGGNLRLGIRTAAGSKWLHEADEVVARYRPGTMRYEVRDALLGDGGLSVVALVAREQEALLVRVKADGVDAPEPELLVAFGGVDGWRGRRGGDIGCESQPVAELFRMNAARCAGNRVAHRDDSFAVHGPPALVAGRLSGEVELGVAAAGDWEDPAALFNRPGDGGETPVVTGRCRLGDEPRFIAIQRLAGAEEAPAGFLAYREGKGPAGLAGGGELAAWFEREEQVVDEIARRLVVETPDPFIDAAVAALNVAEDAVWHDGIDAYLHGGVAWRRALLGWRVSYAGNVIGDHGRTAKHFEKFAREQNTDPIPDEIPEPEASANLSRNENALHSNGNMTSNHYDMNLVAVDAFFRHLRWTGDLEFARRMWPVIERHLAWEQRLFRREFDGLPVYEAYASIWASDDLGYNGGGVTHSTAYNLFHHRMAAEVAGLLGEDATAHAAEAGRIARGIREQLWLADRGWFAESRDLLGLRRARPEPAAWTFYHTLDSEVPDPFEAWQMSRFVDTRLVRIPIEGEGIPAGFHVMPTTSWMPYSWSLNNVVFGEMMHSALGYWQANRPEGAFPLFKGAVLDSMYAGKCPGNVGMCTWFDANRRESQRDFSDGVGAMSRAVMEGLFGVKPDLLAGEVLLRPGFPGEWEHATMKHRDFDLAFRREGMEERFSFTSRFDRPVGLRLQLAARGDRVAGVEVNGEPAEWRMLEDSVGLPRIELLAKAAEAHEVVVRWSGGKPAGGASAGPLARGERLAVELGAPVVELADPQGVLEGAAADGRSLGGSVAGRPGHRTLFAKVQQGELSWWVPVAVEVDGGKAAREGVDWNQPVAGELEEVDLSGRFNAAVRDIFRNEYLEPRSPYCSLAVPKQGTGTWCHPDAGFDVDDSGLRQAGSVALPNGVRFTTPRGAQADNVVFVSQWNNYPVEAGLPLSGRAAHAYLLMAGSTDAMRSRIDNGEVVVSYADGTSERLALRNPETWWPIDQDYFIDDFAFAFDGPLPPRVDLATGKVRVLERESFFGQGRTIPGGAATVLDLPLDPEKELESLTLRALANEVVIGLMGVVLER